MSKLALFGLLAGATLLGIGPGNAFFGNRPSYEGPWCVQYNAGPDLVQENCAMPNFEACNIERARWGSTAFCRQNQRFPGYWAGSEPEPRASKSRRKHRN